MAKIAYVDGRYVAHAHAAVHIEDRGYQFADSVYEVVLVVNGQFVDCNGHLKRLHNSLKELQIDMPVSETVLRMIMRRMLDYNQLKNGIIYMQVTRGVARRDHKFPEHSTPYMVMTVKHVNLATGPQKKGVSAITVRDQRWARRDIKTVQLLANCMAKQKAFEQGAYEAIMIMDDDTISEGSSTNVWIVTSSGELITRPASHDILNGITRQSVHRLAQQHQLSIKERPFSREEMMAAKEVFLTSASAIVTAVTQIDGEIIDKGEIGPVAEAMREAYISYARTGT